MLASYIITQARKLLTDPDAVRWSDADLLGWLNGAQRQIVAVRPDANAKKIDRALVAGSEQSLPTDGTKLLDVIRNTSGRAVTMISRDQLTALNVSWFTMTPVDVVKHFTFDDQDPKSFHVYPPATTAASVRLLYAALPTDCATLGSDIALDAIYEGPLIDWVCYRAWSIDGDSPADQQRAANAIATFMQALTGKTTTDKATEPRRK